MSGIPTLEVMTRVYEGRKAVGFRLMDMNTGAEYVQSDENVAKFIQMGAITDLVIIGKKISSGEISLSGLPKEDLRTGRIIETVAKAPRQSTNKLSIKERHEKIINAFIDDGSINYGLHTCVNMIKLYKLDELTVKVSDSSDIVNGLKVVIEDARNGLYYVMRINVDDSTNKTNEVWRLYVEMVVPAKVSKSTKLSSIKPMTIYGKTIHPDGYYINDDGTRVFVDMRNVKADRVLTTKEWIELRLQRGQSTKLTEVVLGEVVPINGYSTEGRMNIILKVAQYMYMFNQLTNDINSKLEIS